MTGSLQRLFRLQNMGLVRRTGRVQSRDNLSVSSSFDTVGSNVSDSDNGKRKTVGIALPIFMLCGLFCIYFAIHNSTMKPSETHQQILTEGVYLTLDMVGSKRDSKKAVVGLGPHRAMVSITLRTCPEPRVYMRLTGDALVFVPLKPEENNRNTWSATFSMPLEGTYDVETRWFGCEGTERQWKQNRIPFIAKNMQDTMDSPKEEIDEDSEEKQTKSTSAPSSSTSNSLFPQGVWLARKKFDSTHTINSRYLWIAKDYIDRAASVELRDTSSPLGDTTVVINEQGTPVHSRFGELSNYELVCWVGNVTALHQRTAFLGLKNQMFKHQKNFKFHHYSTSSFSTPDTAWNKEGFRKCKNVLVTLDEFEVSLSQHEYKVHVLHFLRQVVSILNDDTFPIWMFTMTEPPTQSSMCSQPSQRSSSHPCNDVLKEIFASDELPPRVKLLDNSDLSQPQFDDNPKDIIGVIALRIMAIVGKQVHTWREAGQRGQKEGLNRKGVVEPNQPFVPYNFTKPDMGEGSGETEGKEEDAHDEDEDSNREPANEATEESA